MSVLIILQELFRWCFTSVVLLDDYNSATVGGEIKLYSWI